MEMKSLVSTLINIFQDAVIHIPYFASTIKPTSTLGITIDEGQKQYEQFLQLISKQSNIIANQSKLYYEKQNCYKTVIIQFQTVEQAKKFYEKYNKNNDKVSSTQILTKMEQEQKDKYLVAYCKDITRNGVNMEQILFKFGKISIIPPDSAQIRELIKQVAKLVIVEGIRGEQELLKCKELSILQDATSLLDFMDPKYLSSEANYYRWRVYSYLQGDGDRNYRSHPFQITLDGPTYYPPEDYSQKYSFKVLTFEERQCITKLLQTLSSRKYHIEQAMCFCVNNVNSAIQISCIIAVCIIDSCISLNSTSQQNKTVKNSTIKHLIALFYLISDILFNNPTTIYRDIFIVLLPSIATRLPQITQLNMKIREIVQIWNKKFIFQEEFLSGLTLLINRQLPSMLPQGMQQMTRLQHQCYKQLLKLESNEEIQAMCWKYGLTFSNQKIAECLRNLAAVLALIKKKQTGYEIQPQPGTMDGEPLNEKDLIKIKSKACRVVSCEDIPIKNLFDKEKSSKSISYDKQ